MRKLSKKSLCLAAAALALTAGISAGTAMAYFTTYAEASGNVTLNMGFTETKPTEEFSNWTKHVTVKNTGDFACFVRVKVLAGEKYQDGLQYSDSDGKWTPGEEGYYYYSEPVAPGESSSVLDIKIDPFVFKEPKLDLIEANPVSDHKFSFSKRFVVFL